MIQELTDYIDKNVNMSFVDQWVPHKIIGFPASELTKALLAFLVMLLITRICSHLVLRRVRKFLMGAKRSLVASYVKAIEAPLKVFMVLASILVSLLILTLNKNIERQLIDTFDSFFWLIFFWFLMAVIRPISLTMFPEEKIEQRKEPFDFASMFVTVSRILLFFLGAIVVFGKWGVNVVGFVASLGVVGAAVAFAAKDSVANIFGTLMIYMDKTFEKGDRIQTEDVHGMVENMGLRSTKVRTLYNSLVTVPNSRLSAQAITNWSRVDRRRIKSTLRLEYKTTREQLETILSSIRNLLETSSDVDTRMTTVVNFTEFGESALEIELSCFMFQTDYEPFMEARERLFLEIRGIISQAGASFALPSQTVYFQPAAENRFKD